MKKMQFVVAVIMFFSLLLSACAPEQSSAPDREKFQSQTEIQWLTQLADPENAALAIIAIGGIALADDATVVGIADDQIAVILIAGVISYAVINNPEIVSGAIEATVSGVEGVERWVRDNISISLPMMFKPEGGQAEIKMPGIRFSSAWGATEEGGCNYTGELNGTPLTPLPSGNPCDPSDYLAWLASQLKELGLILGGAARAEEFLRALTELFQPFVR